MSGFWAINGPIIATCVLAAIINQLVSQAEHSRGKRRR